MGEQPLLLEKKGHVATLVINRPEKKNSLTPLTLFAIADVLEQWSRDEEIRTVVIRGAGDKAFSSGYDLSAIPTDLSPDLFEALKKKNPLEVGFRAIETYPYPVIAMIDGFALGAGCELAITCDLRVASDTSRMGIPPSRLGVIYHPAGVQKFINVLGLANAKEVFFTGRYYDIDRAKAMGMVHYVVPKADLYDFTYRLAEEIAGNAPLALKGHKHVFNKLLHAQGIHPQDQAEIERMIQEAFNSEDLKEGTMAFFGKRKAEFKGK
jgi:enoyl-CoA hydratase/carnithine racemase